MRIAQIASSEVTVPPRNKNGLEFIVSWLTEELVQRGHSVTLFASADSKTTATLKPLFQAATGDDTKRYWGDSEEVLMRALWNFSYAASQAGEFDILHSHFTTIPPLFAPFVRTPVVTTLHEPFRPHSHLDYFTNQAHPRFLQEQYQKIAFATVSERQGKLFGQSESFKRTRTIYNGIPVSQFVFSPRSEDYLLFLGYLNKDKGADTAVTVARTLGKRLILAGNADTAGEFFQTHIAPFLDDRIQYVGPVGFDEKVQLYGSAEALLAPLTWEEPFGLTLIESQACGTPVIAFSKGAAPELIRNGETGFVVESLEAVIAAVEKISSINRSDCREWVEKEFTVARMADRYEEYYKDIIAGAI